MEFKLEEIDQNIPLSTDNDFSDDILSVVKMVNWKNKIVYIPKKPDNFFICSNNNRSKQFELKFYSTSDKKSITSITLEVKINDNETEAHSFYSNSGYMPGINRDSNRTLIATIPYNK